MEKHSGLFATPFSRKYWGLAAGEVRSVRMIALAALFIALQIVMSAFFIPLAADGSLRVYFSFIVTALGSLIYGPVTALMTGFASDLIGFAVHSTGPFFPGYTLTSMLSAFFYAIFFYRARITWARIFLCKLSVNFLINVALGSIWKAMMYSNTFYFYLVSGFLKNVIFLIPELLLLGLFLQLMLPVAERMGLVPRQPTRLFPFW